MLSFIKVRPLYLALAGAALTILPGIFAAPLFGKYTAALLAIMAPGVLAWTCTVVSIVKNEDERGRERARAEEVTRLTLERLHGAEQENLRRRDRDILMRLM